MPIWMSRADFWCLYMSKILDWENMFVGDVTYQLFMHFISDNLRKLPLSKKGLLALQHNKRSAYQAGWVWQPLPKFNWGCKKNPERLRETMFLSNGPFLN